MKSDLSLYWKVWIAEVICLLLMRYVVFHGCRNDMPLILFTVYLVPTWIAVCILGAVEGRRMMKHIEQLHLEEWRKVCSRFMPPQLSWFLSDKYFGDDEAFPYLRRNVIHTFYFAIAVLVTAIPLFLAVVFPGFGHK